MQCNKIQHDTLHGRGDVRLQNTQVS